MKPVRLDRYKEGDDPVEAVEAADLPRAVDRILEAADLNDRERAVLRMRFGLDGQEPMTLEEVGENLGVTRERVRQIERLGLRGLRYLRVSRQLRDWL